jgi:glutamine---fructose-6-phosphate transaminase (isomerizing)
MENRGTHTYSEITSQPDAWADALVAFAAQQAAVQRGWTSLAPSQVLFTGCGSTHYLAQVAASLFQELTGVPARSCPASEILLWPRQVLADPGNTLLVAVSRSGTTTETLEAMNKFRRLGGKRIWSITCYADSPLALGSDLVLLAEAAQEESIAQTRSFASMLVLAKALAANIAGHDIAVLERLPELGRRLIGETASLAEGLGSSRDLDRFFFLGSGVRYGLAAEAMLKMKEMSLTYSEAYHFMEFRHGPMSMVNEQTLVAGLLSQEARPHEQKVVEEMAGLGAQTLSLCTDAGSHTGSEVFLAAPDLPTWASLVLYLPPLQLMAYHRSISKGLDPDNPTNLSAVIFLDSAAFGEN